MTDKITKSLLVIAFIVGFGLLKVFSQPVSEWMVPKLRPVAEWIESIRQPNIYDHTKVRFSTPNPTPARSTDNIGLHGGAEPAFRRR
jgi:hypothetical protein